MFSPPPRCIGFLVNNVTEIVEAPWHGGLARRQPFLARLPALPGPCREPKDFDFNAAALERAGQNIGATRRDHDRAPAHGTGVVQEQRHHGIAEIGFALALERQRVHRIGNDAGQARGIQHAFVEIEIPAAVLLGQEAALQFISKARHRSRQGFQLLVEKCPQALQLFRA